MTGYLQRLVARRVASPGAPPAVRPTIRSASPVAEADQRMNVELFADPMSAPPDQVEAGAVAESRTIPSYKLAPPASAQPRQPAPTAPPPIHRFVAPQAAVPTALSPPAAPPSPGVAPAVAAERNVAPPRDARDPSPPQPSLSKVAAPPLPAPMRPAIPAPAASESGPGDIQPLAPQPRDARSLAPVTAITQVLQQVEASPEPSSLPVDTAVEPEPRRPPPLPRGLPASDLNSAPRRIEREIELNGTTPVHAPGPPPRHVLVREIVRVAPPALQPAPPPPSRGPRTAEEASVIGPLARPDRVRARLELWLR